MTLDERADQLCRLLWGRYCELNGRLSDKQWMDCVLATSAAIEWAVAERDAVIAKLVEALSRIKNELGVPQPGYPQPVANAYRIADAALKEAGHAT